MKLLLVINIEDDVAEVYEDFTVDYDLRGTPKDDQKANESIKYVEDCPLKPMPKKYIVNDIIIETERDAVVGSHGIALGRNLLIEELEK